MTLDRASGKQLATIQFPDHILRPQKEDYRNDDVQ